MRRYGVASGASVVRSVYIADYEFLLFLSWVGFFVFFLNINIGQFLLKIEKA